MSLINDALRRARQANPAGMSRASTPPLRPVDALPRSGHGSLFTLPFLGAVVMLVTGIMLWEWSRAGKTMDIKVRANSRSGGETVSVPEPPVTPPLSQPVKVAAAVPTTTGIPASNAIAAPASEPGANGTNMVEARRPEPPAYKLQGIFYKRGNPSAAINGRTVFVGGKVGEARVTAISQESVTIVTGAGQTKVLEIGD